MSAYDEQDELEKLKQWWKEYGNSAIFGILLGGGILFGFRYWTQHTEQQLHSASVIYQKMFQELSGKSFGPARQSGETLVDQYASTPYAGMAALLLARLDYEAGDAPGARKRLQWVLDKADDPAVKHAARLRLARILLDSGDKEAALALADVKDIAGFETEYGELKGDIFVAQGNRDAARQAYEDALKRLPPGSPYAPFLKMKRDDLGLEKSS